MVPHAARRALFAKFGDAAGLLMDWRWIFASQHLADLVLLCAAVEALWLIRWRGWPVGATVLALLPGICLMLALRAALAGAAWPWVPAALIGSLASHLADLRRRPWRSGIGSEIITGGEQSSG